MNYTLRDATTADCDILFSTYRETVGPYIKQAWGWDEEFQTNGFWSHHPVEEFNVIEVQNKLVGAIHYIEEKNNLYIKMIFLLPKFQGKGIGSNLITHIYQLAQSQNKSLYLTVIKSNPAKKLYDRLGFKIVIEDNNTYEMRWR